MSDPNITHAFEQYAAFARDFTSVVATYFKGLLAQGFTRTEALQLTVSWQRDTLERILRQKDGPIG